MKVAGEEGDVNQETLSSWDERSRELLRGYEPRNVWNMDETGQFWKALPDKSLSERGKCCHGGKNSKERATCTGPFSLVRQARKRLLLLLERVATHAASSY